MTDQTQTQAQAARADLAFLKAVAEDGGPLPPIIGAHMLAAGLPFGLNFIFVWAVFAGHAPWWPQSWQYLTWVPGALVYLPACLVLSLSSRGQTPGPTAKLFITAWTAVGLIVLPIIAVMFVAQIRTNIPFALLWPALSFVLWGGAWASLGVIRKKAWHGLVAAGSIATGLAGAALINDPSGWLVMAAGLLACIAVPGAGIAFKARWAS